MSSNWLEDQQDPDNFLVIPEFGVKPREVNFEGFALPLVHPGADDPETAENMRTMLRLGRETIRPVFTTRAAIIEKATEADDMEPSQWTRSHSAALAFSHFEIAMRNANAHGEQPARRLTWLAQASVLLAILVSGDTATLTKIIFQNHGRIGGKFSGESRKKEALDREAVVNSAKEMGWPAVTTSVHHKLGLRHDVGSSYIGRILKKSLQEQATGLGWPGKTTEVYKTLALNHGCDPEHIEKIVTRTNRKQNDVLPVRSAGGLLAKSIYDRTPELVPV